MTLSKIGLTLIALLASLTSGATLKYDPATYATVADYCTAITTGDADGVPYADNIYYCTLFTESIYFDYWDAFLTGAKLS
jgi:hypothetical protein